ncbi:siderophore-iron reductase FhuF [Effusibacillus consociatus]|uniref:Siderophore-iron reductase FhuF n=1 Tax=Effusibacillus consociatus TaxID=1117041 RepID=A0ABV9Q067_9BACL
MNGIVSLENVLDQLRSKGLHLPVVFPDGLNKEPVELNVVSVQDLLSGDKLEDLIARAARRMNSGNLAAAASLFQKRYASALLASVLNPLLRENIGILADSEQTEIVLEDDLPAGIRLKDPSKWVWLESGSPLITQVFEAVFDDNLGQLIYRIASEFGLSPMIMWGNVGNYIGYVHEQFSKDPSQGDFTKEIFDRLLKGSGFNAPPFCSTYQTVLLEEAEPAQWVRVRSTCCLWYQFPGNQNKPCSTCPRLSGKERTKLLAKSKKA